jgi:hypothetical protein
MRAINTIMGSAASTDRQIAHQEEYVSRQFGAVKGKLPQGLYNDQQIKGRLRQQYNDPENVYSKKDSWIMDSTWKKATARS